MSTTVVQFLLTDAANNPLPNTTVQIRLATGTGFGQGGNSLILENTYVTSDATGLCSVPLTPQSQIDPTGTHYEIDHPAGDTLSFVVSDAVGPLWLRDLLVANPASPSPVQVGAVLTNNGNGTASVASGGVTTEVSTTQIVAATLTANGNATAGHHTPVDATSGAVTVTLPSVSASNVGAKLSVEKIDTSANAVTVSGSIRGTASTLTLTTKGAAVELLADSAGSWWPIHSPLVQSIAAADSSVVVGGTSGAPTVKVGDLSATYGPLAPQRMRNYGQTVNRVIDPTQAVGYSSDPFGQLLTIPTGYAGNDVVEPTVLFDASAPFLGYEYVLCAAPYYQSNATYENPCLWVSHDGITWVPVVNGVPTSGYGGTATPLFPNGVQGDGNLSDPTLYRGPDGTFYVLWNQWINAAPSGSGTNGNNWAVKISKASSLAGPWSTPVNAITTVLATIRPSSPSIFWDGQQWHLYAVDLTNVSATTFLHYTNPSADPTSGTWTKQSNPAIAMPAAYSTQVWWHLNAYLSGSQHVIVAQDSRAGSSGGGHLWLITSNDGGTTWTVPTSPVIAATSAYRSALVFSADGSLDAYCGRLGTNWELRRIRIPFQPVVMTAGNKYGGVGSNGVPVNASALVAARVPLPPYILGDLPSRADSSTAPGTADSGQAWAAASGVIGISSKQFYAPTAGNNKITVTGGSADGVTTLEIVTPDNSSQYGICRYTDGSNFVRFGQIGAGTYCIQNIVAGAVATNLTSTTNAAAGDHVALVCSGSTVTLYVNGQVLLTGSGSGWTSNQSATGVGLQMAGTTGRIRSLTHRPLVNGA